MYSCKYTSFDYKNLRERKIILVINVIVNNVEDDRGKSLKYTIMLN